MFDFKIHLVFFLNLANKVCFIWSKLEKFTYVQNIHTVQNLTINLPIIVNRGK